MEELFDRFTKYLKTNKEKKVALGKQTLRALN